MHLKSPRTLRIRNRGIVSLIACCLALPALLGCEEGAKVIYSEKIALLPDASGLLTKEVRSLPKGGTELAIVEVVGKQSRDIVSFPISDSDDVKFHSGFGHDTVLLYHTRPDLEKSMKVIGPASFPVRVAAMEPAAWMAYGTEEGSPVFYAPPDKWKAYLEMSKKH